MSFETTLELRTLLEQEIQDTSPSATTQTRFLDLLNRAHKVIVAGGGELNLDDTGNPIRRPFLFPWALQKNPVIVNLEPKQTGTAAITQLSTSVTIDINSATKDLTEFHIRFGGVFGPTYRIVTHVGLVLTLDGGVVEDTDASIAFDSFRLRYTVPVTDLFIPVDTIRISGEQVGVRNQSISMIDISELLDQWPLSSAQQRTPRQAAVIEQTTATITLQYNSFPVDFLRTEFRYIPAPADLTIGGIDPIIPKHHRTVLVYLAAFYHSRKRDDDRASSFLRTAKQLFDSLTTEARQILGGNDEDFGVVHPWPGGFDETQSDLSSSILVDVF